MFDSPFGHSKAIKNGGLTLSWKLYIVKMNVRFSFWSFQSHSKRWFNFKLETLHCCQCEQLIQCLQQPYEGVIFKDQRKTATTIPILDHTSLLHIAPNTWEQRTQTIEQHGSLIFNNNLFVLRRLMPCSIEDVLFLPDKYVTSHINVI